MKARNSKEMAESDEVGTLLLDVGISLIQAGASTSRTKTVMFKFAKTFHYVPHIIIGAKVVSLVLSDDDNNIIFNGIRSTALHGIDFSVISGIDRLSYIAAEKRLSPQELKKQLDKYQVLGHYPYIIILFFVSVAGAAFCYNFGGSYTDMAITFGATFCGLFVKQQLTKFKVNPFTCTYSAAATASLFVGLFDISGLINSPVKAFSTCVLFLIPGVLLINSFVDLIDGNTTNGIARIVSAFIHILAIALGLLTTIIILNLND
jgi:uncharacterized membrane protein YjjP (DUF1212 family)